MTSRQRAKKLLKTGAPRVLELTLKRQWFEMVASGEKREEYREPTKWIMSRLENKTYNFVRFRNGYAHDAPECVCEYRGWRWGYGKAKWGARKSVQEVIIRLGRVLYVK